MRRLARDQRGITGLETAIILIAFVVVAAVFAYTALSAGIFSAQKGQETIYSGLKQAAGSMELKGGMIAYNKVASESIGTGDAATTVFYLAYAPILANSETIYVDGVAKADPADYSIVDGTGAVTFVAAPANATAITATYQAAASKVAKISFVVSNGVGGEPIDLTVPTDADTPPDGAADSGSTHKAVISYRDKNQFINNLAWTKTQLGFGDSDNLLEQGEEFLIMVNLRALTTEIGSDTEFTLDFKPMQGGSLIMTRTIPNTVDKVMNLR
ncbi:MAG: hypothetical protein HY671_02600 [Chloroflexi bacterium]|nr:hypothetical protein [Chloroflexota bacterium]